jgi:UDP-galactopyranose mutase
LKVERLPILVYSHLRWDSVFQRPQQIISRLVKTRSVLFIEEPLPLSAGERMQRWDVAHPLPNLRVCRPRIASPIEGFDARHTPTLIGMLRSLLTDALIDRHVAWLYSPMAVLLARSLSPELLVYDCMDELSGFLHAPPEIVEREAELLRWANVAFTGGPSLYRAKRARHANIHCFPSSVDAAHFGKACTGTADHAEQRDLPRPRLGFFGVLDERLDTALVREVAEARPEWQIVLVGPVAKISPSTLPRRPNIHYMGPRPYAELPSFLAGWDVCLLPFALNAATRYISPTKTLEYMAAERPIVSTPITDVVEPYGDVVAVARTPDEFVDACDRSLRETDACRASRVRRMREVLARTSWDATVQAMERELSKASAQRRLEEASPPALRTAPAPGALVLSESHQ